MFKPKTKKPEEVEAEIVEVIEAIDEGEIESEEDEEEFTKDKDGAVIAEITEIDGKPVDENLDEVEEDTVEKPTEQKVNLTQGEVISIIEFNLQRAIQSLQLLK